MVLYQWENGFANTESIIQTSLQRHRGELLHMGGACPCETYDLRHLSSKREGGRRG